MAFRPKAVQPDFDALKSVYMSSQDQTKDYALFQTVIGLMDNSAQMQKLFAAQLDALEEAGGSDDLLDDQINTMLLMGG